MCTYLFHRLGLGCRSYTGDRETDVNGGSDTLVEQLGLQEDLAVSDGDHVGGDVSGHITSLQQLNFKLCIDHQPTSIKFLTIEQNRL